MFFFFTNWSSRFQFGTELGYAQTVSVQLIENSGSGCAWQISSKDPEQEYLSVDNC